MYTAGNGCTQNLALALAVERYREKVESNPPPSRQEGAGVRGGITGGVKTTVILPVELQAAVFAWSARYNSPVNIVIAKAVEVAL